MTAELCNSCEMQRTNHGEIYSSHKDMCDGAKSDVFCCKLKGYDVTWTDQGHKQQTAKWRVENKQATQTGQTYNPSLSNKSSQASVPMLAGVSADTTTPANLLSLGLSSRFDSRLSMCFDSRLVLLESYLPLIFVRTVQLKCSAIIRVPIGLTMSTAR